jgi:small subunit ribosomal protein S21
MRSRLARSGRGGFVTFRNGQDGEGFDRTYGGAPRHRPLEVTVGDRGVEGALRLFKRLVLRDGILREVKRHAHYEKPGDRRRRKVREAARRLRKRLAKARQRGEQIE